MGWSTVGGVAGGIASLISGGIQRRELKRLQQETWNREDTAMQRRVADLKAAGLHPALAAGGPGAAASQPAPGMEAATAMQDVGSSVQRGAELAGSMEDIWRTQSERDRIKSETGLNELLQQHSKLDYKQSMREYEIFMQRVQHFTWFDEQGNMLNEPQISWTTRGKSEADYRLQNEKMNLFSRNIGLVVQEYDIDAAQFEQKLRDARRNFKPFYVKDPVDGSLRRINPFEMELVALSLAAFESSINTRLSNKDLIMLEKMDFAPMMLEAIMKAGFGAGGFLMGLQYQLQRNIERFFGVKDHEGSPGGREPGRTGTIKDYPMN